MKTSLIIVAVLVALASGRFFKPKEEKLEAPSFNQSIAWFNGQLLDHFAPYPKVNWSQRYFIQQDYFNPQTGPVFLFICGESECNGIPQRRQFVLDLAIEFKGIVLSLEHRFYGQSQPFGYSNTSYSTQNLQYLSHEQGLYDLAYFMEYIRENSMYNITSRNPWITIGGSYPGALSAWFRYKFPHLTVGALASSAVVNSILDFKQYDYQIYLSTNLSGVWCPQMISNLTTLIETYLTRPRLNQALKQRFHADNLTDVDFLSMISDLYSGLVQYEARTQLCGQILVQNASLDDNIENLAKYNDVNGSPASYTDDFLLNTTYDETKADRQWTYQTCTEYGWFQSANDQFPMRSSQINLTYFQNICQNVFGTDYLPMVNATNNQMGGVNMRINNIIFTNGIEDPFKWASITQNVGQMQAYVANCTNCAHCIDLSTPTGNDSPNLVKIRQNIIKAMNSWISTHFQQLDQQTEYQEDFVRSKLFQDF